MNFAFGAELRSAVPASLPIGEKSLTSVAPSTRQTFSASSVSTRLHWGQRFIPTLSSLGQIHPTQQILEARVVAERFIRNVRSNPR